MDRIVDHADRVEQFSRCGNQHRFVTGHHPGPFLKSNRRSAQFGSWVKLLRWFSEKGDAAVGVDRRYQKMSPCRCLALTIPKPRVGSGQGHRVRKNGASRAGAFPAARAS